MLKKQSIHNINTMDPIWHPLTVDKINNQDEEEEWQIGGAFSNATQNAPSYEKLKKKIGFTIFNKYSLVHALTMEWVGVCFSEPGREC